LRMMFKALRISSHVLGTELIDLLSCR
jgi:hypothetical protein